MRVGGRAGSGAKRGLIAVGASAFGVVGVVPATQTGTDASQLALCPLIAAPPEGYAVATPPVLAGERMFSDVVAELQLQADFPADEIAGVRSCLSVWTDVHDDRLLVMLVDLEDSSSGEEFVDGGASGFDDLGGTPFHTGVPHARAAEGHQFGRLFHAALWHHGRYGVMVMEFVGSGRSAGEDFRSVAVRQHDLLAARPDVGPSSSDGVSIARAIGRLVGFGLACGLIATVIVRIGRRRDRRKPASPTWADLAAAVPAPPPPAPWPWPPPAQ